MILFLILFLGACSAAFAEIEVVYASPSPEEYVVLRSLAGMLPRSLASAKKGIENSLFWITIRENQKLIGMGRVIGDGGTVVQITDIAVHPAYQRQGYGTMIFDAIQQYILHEIPDDAFVCLFAEKEIASFYSNKGFVFATDKWPGMFWPCDDRKKLNCDPNE